MMKDATRLCVRGCAYARVCVLYACDGGGAEALPYCSDMLVLDLLEREDVTYKVDSTVNADRSLSS